MPTHGCQLPVRPLVRYVISTILPPSPMRGYAARTATRNALAWEFHGHVPLLNVISWDLVELGHIGSRLLTKMSRLPELALNPREHAGNVVRAAHVGTG